MSTPTPWISRSVALLIAAMAFVAWLFIGFPAAGDSLDLSWTTVMSWGFSTQAQWGRDIVFTFGPLGFLYPASAYYGSTAKLYLLGQFTTAALWAFLVFYLSLRCRPFDRILLAVLLLIWFPFMAWDVGYYFAFVLGAAVVYRALEAERPLRLDIAAVAVACLLLTILALTKFTLFLLWLAFFALLAALLVTTKRYAMAIVAALALPALLMTLWICSGQAISSFAPYLSTSLELASGYAAAMSVPPPLAADLAGVAVLTIALAVLASAWFRRRLGDLAFSAFLAGSVVLAWKGGYTRADGHIVIFFAAAACAMFAELSQPDARLGAPAAGLRRAVVLAVFAVGAISTAAVVIRESGQATWSVATLKNRWNWHTPFSMTQAMLSPEQLLRNRERSRAVLAEQFSLSKTRERIADRPVDLLMHEQGILFLNDLNYAPRPIFQGYGAYKPALARLNEAKLIGPTAPDFLLVKLQAIDSRLPTSEDPLSLLAAFRRYRPVAAESGFLLFERNDSAAVTAIPPAPGDWQSARMGDEIPLPDNGTPQLLYFEVMPTFAGRFVAAALREPMLWLNVKLSDGSIHTHRIVRPLGQSGFLLSPYFASTQDYVRWYGGSEVNRVTSIQFHTNQPALLQATMRLAFAPLELPRASMTSLDASLRALVYPGFSASPVAQEGDIRPMQEGAQEVLSMHAPAALTFALSKGRWKLHGSFGIRAAAYDLPDCAKADGVELIAEISSADGSRTVVGRRELNPFLKPDDRGEQVFDFGPFDAADPQSLFVRFSAGTSATANLACDWSYLHRLDLENPSTP